MSNHLRKQILVRAQFIVWLEQRIDKRLAQDFDIYDSLVKLLNKEKNELDELVSNL